MSRRPEIFALAKLFLRLGVTAFGGPAAHIAMMRDEVVTRRAWLTDSEFLDLLGATNFIPGPNSTEMAIHIGHRRAGFLGLVVAGTCFILPAALITFGFAWLYVRYGRMPHVAAILHGVKPVIVAIVIEALYGLGKTAVKNRELMLLGAAAAVANALGVNELLVLFGAAVLYALRPKRAALGLALFPGLGGVTLTLSTSGIFLIFAKIGSVLFGSGYVLLAFLRADLVEQRHWLTESQLIDAVAVGQLTPGPVFTTATFIGYVLGGGSGAIAATLGIFLPAFVFVALSGPLVPKLRRSVRAGYFLDGLNVASLALMAIVTFSLARAALIDVLAVAICIVSGVLSMRYRVNSVWLVLGGAVIGGVSGWLN